MVVEQSHIRMQKLNPDTDLTLSAKINTKGVRDLNVKCETIKLLEDNIGEKSG